MTPKQIAMSKGALCEKCPLRNQPIALSELKKDAKFSFVGSAPTKADVKQKQPISGQPRKLFDIFCGDWDEDVNYINVTLCEPKGRSLEPDAESIACCATRLKNELAGVDYVLACGKTAQETLLPQIIGLKNDEIRGRWRYSESTGTKVLCSYHPLYIVKSKPQLAQDFILDIRKWQEANPRPKLNLDDRTVVLKSIKDVETMVAAALDSGEPICVDIETSHKDRVESRPNEWWNGIILAIGIGWASSDKIYIIEEKPLYYKKMLKLLQPIFESKAGIFGHNVKFDALYLLEYYRRHEITCNMHLCDDTMIMHHLLDERTGGHDLKNLAQYYFDAEDYEASIKKYLKKPNKDSYCGIPQEVLNKYLAYDIYYTIGLRERFEADLKAENLWERPYKYVLCRAINIIARMEFYGMPIDYDIFNDIASQAKKQLEVMQQELFEIAGHEFNPNSPQQVATILYDELGLPTIKKYKVKPRSTSKLAMDEIKHLHPIIPKLQEFRAWAKLVSTYTEKMPLLFRDYRVSYPIKLHGTETGRVSGGLLLTMPREDTPAGGMLRKTFRVRDPEKTAYVACDASQAELRWGGWFALEKELYRVFEEGGDLHSEAAKLMFGDNYGKQQRVYAKNLNFSYLYGGNEFSFATTAGVPKEQAIPIVRKYAKIFSGLTQWRNDTEKFARTNGYIRTPLGRKRRFPLFTDLVKPPEIINFGVQSVTTDVTMLAFCVGVEECMRRGLWIKPILFLHDGVYIETTVDLVQEVALVFQAALLQAAYYVMDHAGLWFEEYKHTLSQNRIKYKVDVDTGDSWGTLSKLKLDDNPYHDILYKAFEIPEYQHSVIDWSDVDDF